ncbi:hypothetical protein B2J93_5445 [Marssonina coronariae]|uniref:Uncharacterized protein n=1 Tax=Diplocarpon coronariae TaxID=2795749 RepID=A0A218Z1L6_9HELO|nr:hypothetical protein B2J93_5445 [Marssonina coronariae]
MPSFTFLKRSRGVQQALPPRSDSRVVLSAEKEPRRLSKRDYLRCLLKLPGRSLASTASRRKTGKYTITLAQAPLASSAPPEPPVSPMDKPLPPPPPAGLPADPPPPVKLERIIKPIAAADLHKIFSGAPQFFARAEGHDTGAPHPSVGFPWDEELHIRDLTDHWKIHDEAWACVTAWPHITVPASRDPDAALAQQEKQRAHFRPRCRERPNMLSMHGIERGTMGFQAALEMGVADALAGADENMTFSSGMISERRRAFLNGKDGLRPLTDTTLIERLLDVSKLYLEDPDKHQRPTVQLYTELFTQILFPPTRVTEHDDPYSLKVQVGALVDVLAAPSIWFDFSLVEWRIRLGQILWGASLDPDPEDSISINNQAAHEPGTERYWLLVQVLLSCELLVRLDAMSMSMDHGVPAATDVDIHKFERLATPRIKWSLLLARTWLENIRIERPAPEAVAGKKPAGWMATLTGNAKPDAVAAGGLQETRFHGRHQTRQLSGLLHFARNIRWPDMEVLTAKAASNGITISESIQSSPSGTPLTVSTPRSSYFSNRRPQAGRGLSWYDHVSPIIHPAGWLSNCYLSGLILPGEGLSHFLISTLLENDPEAVSRLGEQANLYGGFIYRGQSFWSTACIVGRVLAARKSASDCMGWVYSDVVPRGAKQGWVDIDVDRDGSADWDQRARKPRLWQKQAVERDGHVTGGADFSSVLPGDFTLPVDKASLDAITVTLESLDLFEAAESGLNTPTAEEPTPISQLSLAPPIKTYSAMIKFTVVASGEEKREVNVALNHDVHFVTAHPCIDSPHPDTLSLLMDPSGLSNADISGAALALTFLDACGHDLWLMLMMVTGHPLHKAFTYTQTPLATLLSPTALSAPLALILSPPASPQHPSKHTLPPPHITPSTIPKVLVIDCTDASMLSLPARPASTRPRSSKRAKKERHEGSDLEMLGRAICAERGWSALVSRRGRGCLACAVREAGALGWGVVLRVA